MRKAENFGFAEKYKEKGYGMGESHMERIDRYFASLIGGARNNITVSKVANAIQVTPDIASKILTEYVDKGILSISYAVRCPECNMLIQRFDFLSEMPEGVGECYGCNKEIEVASKDVEILYSLIEKSTSIIEFVIA